MLIFLCQWRVATLRSADLVDNEHCTVFDESRDRQPKLYIWNDFTSLHLPIVLVKENTAHQVDNHCNKDAAYEEERNEGGEMRR